MQASQQPTVTVYGGGAPQSGTVIVQTVAPVVYRPQAPSQRPTVLPHAKLHMIFGIIQMAVGALCVVLDIATVSFATDYQRFGAGIYSGIFFFVPGLLGYLAGKNNSTCCVVGCMVMNIIASCVAVIGLSFASIELGSYRSYYAYAGFIRGKSIFVLCACLFEFVFTIIHASLTCASCCYCCMPRTNVAEATEVTSTTTAQGIPVQQQILYPSQQAYPPQQQPYAPQPGYYPQQAQPQAMPASYMPYPAQASTPAYPQASAHPPFNPAYGPDSTFSDQPPPYESVEQKRTGT